MCISEETVFIMDPGVASISEIFLTELLQDENAAEKAIRPKEENGPLSNIETRTANYQEASLPLFG